MQSQIVHVSDAGAQLGALEARDDSIDQFAAQRHSESDQRLVTYHLLLRPHM